MMAPTKRQIEFAGQDLNMSAVARGVGVTHSQISRIFSGQRNPSLTTARKIATYLGITLGEFLVLLENRQIQIAA